MDSDQGMFFMGRIS